MGKPEIEGEALDRAVALLEGWRFCERNNVGTETWEFTRGSLPDGNRTYLQYLAYSQSWALAGPIIERERIELEYQFHADPSLCWRAHGYDSVQTAYGRTPIEAAMRAYVASAA